MRHGHHGGSPRPTPGPLPPSCTPWHWLPAADSIPWLGLQLQADGEFTLQHKHRLRRAAVHHYCLNTVVPPKVIQDVIIAVPGGVG